MSWSAKYVVTLCLVSVGTAISACAADRTWEAGRAADRETVIVFHGLGRTETAVWLLAKRIEAAGFQVVRIGYNSLDDTPDRILAEVRREVDAFCKASRRPVNFVGHSLGGLIIRGYLAESGGDRGQIQGWPKGDTSRKPQVRCLFNRVCNWDNSVLKAVGVSAGG